jgi:predicted membrane channel-forming protein YqfA (hemolysin III family)
MGARVLHQSRIYLLPILPVQNTALTLFGTIISLYLAGIYADLSGIWKSPTTRANWPIYSSSAMLISLIIYNSLNHQQTISKPSLE